MSVKNEFTKHAEDYNNNNIIQQIIAKALVRETNSKPKTILELGCGSGQVYKNINWDIDKYYAVDFSESMCKLHPKNEKIEINCFDFDSEEFFEFLKNKYFDLIFSSSAMQWSKDLSKLVENLKLSCDGINAVLFTSNTFKTIQKITNKKSPILTKEKIKEAFLNSFDCEFEVYNYNLEFEDKKVMFDYIKNSGVSGGNSLSFKNAKKLYKEYKLNYLEFEVIFVKTISKS
ncbi:methyltransferase domain-containing protein [Arcobacter sp. CECT 8985]|uniref:methyltransferase domain-containing protein n=1 Tax=Arcobacter sp. CECT 8985 TaxID=1935424 RepID=UPI00100B9A41|nr:methyltransferase domain-containing protein [Arcobacter sp. CECT 8985]RXJ84042.1 methyltransferase [Arcobacter sp. CECT 8985]